MAPIKSNSPFASYFDFFSKTGTDAVTPAPGPAATGGSISYYSGKTIHVFTSTADFTNVSGSPLTVDHLVIAAGGGGGSGGGSGAGGGGAGGVRTSIPGLMPATDSQITVSPGSPNKVTVTVGAGGAGSPNYAVAPTIGGDSSFGPTTPTTGGGRAGYYPPNTNAAGGDGGSGGGAAGYAAPQTTLSGGSATSGQGNAGGSAPGAPNYAAGGGGGAGGVGGDASNPSSSGDGGIGVRLPSMFRNPNSVLGTPGPGSTDFWVAGGGGGAGGENTTNFGVGGGSGGPYAGGGNGATRTGSPPANIGGTFPGSINTGGGGGGSNNTKGGDGGSGLVLIAYPT